MGGVEVIRVLASEQDYDDVVRYGQAFRDELVYGAWAANPDIRVTPCRIGAATAQGVLNTLANGGFHMVTGMGHGAYDAFTGQHGVVLWSANTVREGEFQGAIVHFLSCQTAATLGLTIFEGWRAGVLGLRRELHVLYERSSERSPDER